MSLGWIFHVTDAGNLPSIRQNGLKTYVKGSSKGGRDAIHHNDGYIRMADGTTQPRQYTHPVYLVLSPKFIENQQLFLTKNGVVLFHGDISFHHLIVKEQVPTLACNVVHKGRGHSLPPSVTGGTWHSNTTWQHVKKEKGIGFIPGGEIPDTVRTTAWEFMGQEVPPNYGRLVFGTPLVKEDDFDPQADSIHGLAAEGSPEREESAQGSEPMSNPYAQPSRRTGRFSQGKEPETGSSPQREEPATGSSPQREEPATGSSPQREEPEDQWEQQRSSSGNSGPPEGDPFQDDPQQDAQDNQQEEPSIEVQDDPMDDGEIVNLWETEDPPDDYVVEQATKSSLTASNPRVVYEAGIICARDENGELLKNSSGEKVIVLREWNCLLTPQKIALRRQSITRPGWEKISWTGHLCLLFT